MSARRPEELALSAAPPEGRPHAAAPTDGRVEVGAQPPSELKAALIVARLTLRESVRRRVFLIVGLITLLYVVLFALANREAFHDTQEIGVEGVDARVVVGATLAGLGMFATLFLGTVLAVFLTLAAVRGDAERGLLAPLVVRPLRRRTLLFGRWLGATAVCAPYVACVSLATFAIINVAGDWWPNRTLVPIASLAAGVSILAALSLAGSIAFSATANGIAIFMLFGAGLTTGLLGQIAEVISSESLEVVARIATWALPFEALYQSGLAELTADEVGWNAFAINLGPFGGAQSAGPWLWLFSLAYLALVGALACYGFGRRDL